MISRLLEPSARLSIALVLVAITLVGNRHTHSGVEPVTGFQNRQRIMNALVGNASEPSMDEASLFRRCPDYLSSVAFLRKAELQPDEVLAFLDRWSTCWPAERRSLLAYQMLDSLASAGEIERVCRQLVPLQAVTKLLDFTEEAEADGRWQDVQGYLACLEVSNWGNVWISPWRVAVLYQRLGQHLEIEGATQHAVEAYRQAGDRHPGVWAMPIIQGASLLWRQDKRDEAIDWLVNAIARNPDASAGFEIWSQLAEYWNAQDDTVNSRCAYQEAASLTKKLPQQDLTGIDQRLQELAEISPAIEPEVCFLDYPILRAR